MSNPLIDSLYGAVPREQYAAIKCKVCTGIYRWGRIHLWQSACPYCGAIDFSPKEVARLEYIQWLRMLRTPQAMQELQKVLYNPKYVE